MNKIDDDTIQMVDNGNGTVTFTLRGDVADMLRVVDDSRYDTSMVFVRATYVDGIHSITFATGALATQMRLAAKLHFIIDEIEEIQGDLPF